MKEPSTTNWHLPLALATGTCHLPLQGLNHVLLQLLTFNTPWRVFRVESRKEAWCGGGEQGTGKTGLQIVTYLWSWFYEPKSLYFLLISRKNNKILPGDDCFSWPEESFMSLAETFWKNMCLIQACPLPSLESHICWPSPPTSLEQFLKAIWGAVSWAAVIIWSQIQLNNSHIVLFSLKSAEPIAVVVQLLHHVWLCNPMDCNMPGFPVLHHPPEFA